MTTPVSKTFNAEPVTVVIHYDRGDELWIGSHLEWRAGDFVPYDVLLRGMGELKWFPLSELNESAPGMWTGRASSSDSPDGPGVTIRPTVETDAVAAVTTAGGPRVPMPLAVLSDLLESDGSQMPKLWAMSDNDGFVTTMMLDSGAGLYVRASGGWHRIVDADVIDGLTVTEVDDSSLDMFDQFDRAGQMVALSAMYNGSSNVPGEIRTEGSSATPATAPDVVKEVPIIASAADMADAVLAAGDDEGLQWYVECRALALGLEVELPWK